MIQESIVKLVQYGLATGLVEKEDKRYTTNKILELLQMDAIDEEYVKQILESDGADQSVVGELESILGDICDYAYEHGLMEEDSVGYRDLFDTKLTMSKADMLDYHQSMMDHAMVLTGVDLVDGKPAKWKVENSWGPKVGEKGYFVMSDEWMDQYVYQIVVNKKYLSDELKADQAQEPIVLKPWDPMGTLA